MNLNDPKVREAGARALREIVVLHDTDAAPSPWRNLAESRQAIWLDSWDRIAAEIAPLLRAGDADLRPSKAAKADEQAKDRETGAGKGTDELRPLEARSVDLVAAGIVREYTQGMCEAGKACALCDCFAGPTAFARERVVAEAALRFGLKMLAQDAQ